MNKSNKSNQINQAILSAYDQWNSQENTRRLREKDAALWTDCDESEWMGWLNLPILKKEEFSLIESLREEIKKSGVKHIVLLGMGGSSLFPAMMASIEGNQFLFVLDSTDPIQIKNLEKKLDLKHTLFIVSSKSGSTLEPQLFKQYFYARMQVIHNKKEVGEFFLAITDPNTQLEIEAQQENFRVIFNGLPSIGGRYSALSQFGLVPTGLMGFDIHALGEHAKTMAEKCQYTDSAKDNPGVSLGIQLGICGNLGKNKITFIISPAIQAMGNWLEQLLAESTGKNGKALIPIVNEPLGEVHDYDNDRVFIFIYLENSSNSNSAEIIIQQKLDSLQQAGHYVVKLGMPNIQHLGAELYRFEMATAVASSILGINPYNQPDVESTKLKTKEIMQSSNIQKKNPVVSLSIFSSSCKALLQNFLNLIQSEDYFNCLAFIEMSEDAQVILQKLRVLIRDAKKVATCIGFGPRFLHSTGQAHKGGPNTGVFLQLVMDYSEDIFLPDNVLSFGRVINAQAQADLEVLIEKSRRVLQINLGKDAIKGLYHLVELVEQVVENYS